MNDIALGSQTICQVAVVVHDIERSVKQYAEMFGLEPTKIRETDTADVTHIRYRGQPTNARAKLAFFQMGQVSLELIEPIGGPSTWKDQLDQHGESVHHIAFRVPDMKKSLQFLQGKGVEIVQTGDFKGGCYTYADTTPQLGVVLELLASTAK